MDRNVGGQNISYDSLENQENPFISLGFSQLKNAEIRLQVKWSRGVLSGRNIFKMANCDILHYGWSYFWQDKWEISTLSTLEWG